METKPRGQARKFTDDELRRSLLGGTTPAEFARNAGVSRQAVNKRVNQLGLTTASAVVAPEESRRFVHRSLDVVGQLKLNLHRANKLHDACDEWLTDPKNPEKYDLGPRLDEVEVTYEVELTTANGSLITQKRKKKFSQLCCCLEGRDEDGARFVAVQHGEYKRADPRKLILDIHQETRSTVSLYSDLLARLMDYRILEDWRRAVVEEIGKESDECAKRIAARLQRSIVLHAAFAGPDALATGD